MVTFSFDLDRFIQQVPLLYLQDDLVTGLPIVGKVESMKWLFEGIWCTTPVRGKQPSPNRLSLKSREM